MNILEYIKSYGYAAEEDAKGEPWYSEMYHGLQNNVSKHTEGAELATISVLSFFSDMVDTSLRDDVDSCLVRTAFLAKIFNY